MLAAVSKNPGLWLALYGCGSVLAVSATANAAGGMAAGTVAGFLALLGTAGYESLCRIKNQIRSDKRIDTLGRTTEILGNEVSRQRNDLDQLKDDLKKTVASLRQRNVPEKASPASLNIPDPHQVSKVQAARDQILKKAEQAIERRASREAAFKSSPVSENVRLMAAARLAELTANQDNAPVDLDAPVPKFSDTIITELLHHAVAHDRIETFAQPIVRLPNRHLVYLELFARIRARAGVYLPADQYRHLAEKEALISEVDRILLRHALDSIKADARREMKTGYFLNISSRTLKDTAFMADLLDFLKSSRDLARHLIFELQQKDFESMPPQYLAIMTGLAKLGCTFSLDHLDHPQVDATRLRLINVRFLKLDAARLAYLSDKPEGITMIRKFKAKMITAGIELIIERIENENDLRDLLDFDLDYGEGYLFGKPDLEIAYRNHKAA